MKPHKLTVYASNAYTGKQYIVDEFVSYLRLSAWLHLIWVTKNKVDFTTGLVYWYIFDQGEPVYLQAPR